MLFYLRKILIFYIVPLDSSVETGFYGFEEGNRDRVDPSFLENSSSLISKLQEHCPVFFNSLSVWEREIINSSIWLKSVTTKSVSTFS
jgi:hypothetical protein